MGCGRRADEVVADGVAGEERVADGLYAIRFSTRLGEGSGVVVLEGGRFRGGDSRMAYSGRYSFSGDMFSADLTVRTHTEVPGMRSLFGLDTFPLALHGNFAGDVARLIAVSPHAADVELRATLHRLPEAEEAGGRLR